LGRVLVPVYQMRIAPFGESISETFRIADLCSGCCKF
jgi:hypothetical protein